MPNYNTNTGGETIVDPAKIATFEGNLINFKAAMEEVCTNIKAILDNPGFTNEYVTENVNIIRQKLGIITDDWNGLVKELEQHLSLSLQTINATQSALIQETEL